MKRPALRFCLDSDFAGIGELNSITDEIDQDLGQAPAVATAWRQLRSDFDFEPELLIGRQRLQRAADGLGDVLNAVIGEFEHQLTGLDLGQIEHVIDESEQVRAIGLKPFEYAE